MENRQIVIFDGVCNFCNGAVRFISKRDPKGKFAFTPIQSEVAKGLMEKHGISNLGIDTFVLIKNDRAHIYTDAAMEIAKELTGFWTLFRLFKIIPRFIRDFLYRLFARNRYRLFGRTDHCVMPANEIRDRFIGI